MGSAETSRLGRDGSTATRLNRRSARWGPRITVPGLTPEFSNGPWLRPLVSSCTRRSRRRRPDRERTSSRPNRTSTGSACRWCKSRSNSAACRRSRGCRNSRCSTPRSHRPSCNGQRRRYHGWCSRRRIARAGCRLPRRPACRGCWSSKPIRARKRAACRLNNHTLHNCNGWQRSVPVGQNLPPARPPRRPAPAAAVRHAETSHQSAFLSTRRTAGRPCPVSSPPCCSRRPLPRTTPPPTAGAGGRPHPGPRCIAFRGRSRCRSLSEFRASCCSCNNRRVANLFDGIFRPTYCAPASPRRVG